MDLMHAFPLFFTPSGTHHHVSVIDCATQQTLPDPWPIDVYVQHVTAYPEQQRPRGVLPPPSPGSLACLLPSSAATAQISPC